jgi:galactosamine-6-phosphate isomerase
LLSYQVHAGKLRPMQAGKHGTASARGDHLRLPFEVRIAPDAATASRAAAAIIDHELRARPELLVCAAAGGSPAATYQALGELAQAAPQRFGRLRVIQVDEWHGLECDHPATCAADLRRRLVGPMKISEERFVAFHCDAADPERECRRVAAWLAREGPIDVAVLGVGTNGHLAMNEPAAALRPHAHVAELSATSQQHPLLADCPSKPTHGLTLGMADLLHSRRILLLAFGTQKRPVLQRLAKGCLTPQFPVSFLWLHPAVTLLCDEAAGGGLDPGCAP